MKYKYYHTVHITWLILIVLCFADDHSRVVLDREVEGDYINANYIDVSVQKEDGKGDF